MHPTTQNTNVLCALFLQISNTHPLLKCGNRENNFMKAIWNPHVFPPKSLKDLISGLVGRSKKKVMERTSESSGVYELVLGT